MTFARDLASFADSASQNLTFRNKIINGDFGIWQRGTSFTTNGWTADRFYFDANGTGSTNTVSRVAFTPGVAPIAGYEGNYFLRMARSAAGSGNTYNTLYIQNIENVTTLAGQTATISFFGKADSNRTVTLYYSQNFGSGGSGSVSATIGTANLTTSWQRFSITVAIPSILGKTIGTSSFLQITMNTPTAVASTIDIWGVQLEAGPAPTPFEIRPAQTELALCQRYFQKSGVMAMGCESVNLFDQRYPMSFPVTMRIAPTMAVHTVSYTLTTNLRTGTITESNFTFFFNKAGSSGTLQDTSVSGGYEANAEM